MTVTVPIHDNIPWSDKRWTRPFFRAGQPGAKAIGKARYQRPKARVRIHPNNRPAQRIGYGDRTIGFHGNTDRENQCLTIAFPRPGYEGPSTCVRIYSHHGAESKIGHDHGAVRLQIDTKWARQSDKDDK